MKHDSSKAKTKTTPSTKGLGFVGGFKWLYLIGKM
jgi:hypothetical protein